MSTPEGPRVVATAVTYDPEGPRDAVWAEIAQIDEEVGQLLARRHELMSHLEREGPREVHTCVLMGRGKLVHAVRYLPHGAAMCGSRPTNPGEQWLRRSEPIVSCPKCLLAREREQIAQDRASALQPDRLR